jgi:2-isopropylmalate synthase
MFNHTKYSAYPSIKLDNRTWPNNIIKTAPKWCSVDLRDGNQALSNPMDLEQKLSLFNLLVNIGFKEIEIGFPSASTQEFEFVRFLIEQELIPHDVTIQVLTQAREELVKRTFESLKGADKAIVHVYNSTSTVQREHVFGKTKKQITNIALNGAKLLDEYATMHPDTKWTFQYSPESFTGTEMDYALEVCNAVIAYWDPEVTDRNVIINLPSTVEMSSPNVFADQVEYISSNLIQRDSIELCVHTHNDRGCAVASAEMAILAGADRVEGTLLGNGERTGNLDLLTLGMNLYSQGIDPKLDFQNADGIISIVEQCTNIQVHPRHPWIGELVYTAFSGSHQDAIKKSLQYHKEKNLTKWTVPYIPIDPTDIGRDFSGIIRINTQSGKGGACFVLEHEFDIVLPKWIHPNVGKIVQQFAESKNRELTIDEVKQAFDLHYINSNNSFVLSSYSSSNINGIVNAEFNIKDFTLKSAGTGILDALCRGLSDKFDNSINIMEFDERSVGNSTNSLAQACVLISVDDNTYSGIGYDLDISSATIKAVLNAYQRSTLI